MQPIKKISVIISTYNNVRYVEKKLAEISRQTAFQDAEFIFIETASPEKERDLLAPFCASHPNCRLLTYDDRKTLYESWNIGWETAKAPLVCYSNMDDCMHPALLETVIRTFDRDPAIDICSTLIAYQEEDASRDRFDICAMKGRKLCLRPGPFTVWRKEINQKIGTFDPQFFVAGDKDFWSRAYANKLRIKIIWKVLYLFTKSPTQLSKQQGPKIISDQEREKTKPYPLLWPPCYKLPTKLIRPVWTVCPQFFLPKEEFL